MTSFSYNLKRISQITPTKSEHKIFKTLNLKTHLALSQIVTQEHDNRTKGRVSQTFNEAKPKKTNEIRQENK